MAQVNNTQKATGKAIISRAADLDERRGGKVVTPKSLEAERMRNHGSLTDTRGVEMDGVGATSIECCCCYDEFGYENMVQCSDGHRFCFRCLRRRLDEIIYGGVRADAYLSCMSTDDCEVSIPMSEIRRALPNDVIERYEYRQAQEAIAEAKLEGLVYCPFCSIPYIVDVKCVEILDCPNPKCLKASCIQCKKLSHVPLQCEEVEEMSDTYLRRKVEERMSKAVIRECNICHAELIKIAGCNKVRCRCGNAMCYICRQTVSDDYGHFCSCHTVVQNKCKKCNKCSPTETEEEDDEALAGKEEALKELVEKETYKLLDLEIGPPLRKLRQQTRRPPFWIVPPPESDEQGHHMPVQPFPPNWIVPPPKPEEQRHHLQRPPPKREPEQRHHLQHLPVQRFPPNWIVPPPKPEEQRHHLQRPPPKREPEQRHHLQHLPVQRFPPNWFVPPPEPEQRGHHMQRPPQHFPVRRYPPSRILPSPESEVQWFVPPPEPEQRGDHMQRPPQHFPVRRYPPFRILPSPETEEQWFVPPPEPEQRGHHMQRPPQHFPVRRYPPSTILPSPETEEQWFVPPPEPEQRGHHMQRPPQHFPVRRYPPSTILPSQESEEQGHDIVPPDWIVPPPHFSRFDDRDRIKNMAVPPPQFSRQDGQLGNMQLQDQEDHGRE